jgi:hypothetical protein
LVRPIDSLVNAGIHTDIGIGFKAEKRRSALRRIATRYDKTDESFAAFIHLSAALRAII